MTDKTSGAASAAFHGLKGVKYCTFDFYFEEPFLEPEIE